MSAKAKKPVVPRLRFAEFQETGEWEVQKIRQNLSESRVKGSKGDVAKKLTVKLWGNGVFEKQEALKGSANTQYYRRKAGQFIYSKLDFLNQAFGIVPDRLDSYESTVDLPCFDVSDELNVCFLLEYVQRKDFYKKYGEIADGGRKAKRIQVETFLDFPIFLPRMREQQKIAACLTALDDLISAATERLDALKRHKQGLMQQFFPTEGETLPRLRFAEFRDAGEWERKKLENIGEPLMCKRIFKSQTITNSENAVPFYKIGTFGRVADSYISCELYNEYKGKYSFPNKGEILISASGTIGRLVVYNGEAAYFQDSNIVWLGHNEELVKNNFLFYCYSILNWQTSDGGIIKRLYNSDLNNIKVCFPKAKKEQHKIAACLAALDDLIAAQTQKIAKLKIHKRGLMQQLFPAVNETHR